MAAPTCSPAPPWVQRPRPNLLDVGRKLELVGLVAGAEVERVRPLLDRFQEELTDEHPPGGIARVLAREAHRADVVAPSEAVAVVEGQRAAVPVQTREAQPAGVAGEPGE